MENYQAIIVQYWITDGVPASPYVEKVFKPRSSKMEAEYDLLSYNLAFIKDSVIDSNGKIVEFDIYQEETGWSICISYEDSMTHGRQWTTGTIEVVNSRD